MLTNANEFLADQKSEEVTAYVVDSEKRTLIINNLKIETKMNETNLSIVTEQKAEENVNAQRTNNVDSTANIDGQLSDNEINLCKEAEQEIINKLEPEGLAGTVMEKSIINLSGSYKAGKIKVARLKMNRRPKAKAIKALMESLKLFGQQIMLLVIPAKVAKAWEFDIESFTDEDIPEEELCTTVVIIDGQTRLQAYLDAIKEDPNCLNSELYAYFPLNWVSLNEMLTSINLKVFGWKNADFITGVLSKKKIEEKDALEYVKELELAGYNYTSSCEWATLKKGIITKTPLVKAMSSSSSSLDFPYSQYAIEISKAARAKFVGDYESALKQKAFPELIITKWNDAGEELIYSEREDCLKKFFNELSDEEVKNIAEPSGYKRGCGKKKEEFIIEQLEVSFNNFLSNHPYSEFRCNDRTK